MVEGKGFLQGTRWSAKIVGFFHDPLNLNPRPYNKSICPRLHESWQGRSGKLLKINLLAPLPLSSFFLLIYVLCQPEIFRNLRWKPKLQLAPAFFVGAGTRIGLRSEPEPELIGPA